MFSSKTFVALAALFLIQFTRAVATETDNGCCAREGVHGSSKPGPFVAALMKFTLTCVSTSPDLALIGYVTYGLKELEDIRCDQVTKECIREAANLRITHGVCPCKDPFALKIAEKAGKAYAMCMKEARRLIAPNGRDDVRWNGINDHNAVEKARAAYEKEKAAMKAKAIEKAKAILRDAGYVVELKRGPQWLLRGRADVDEVRQQRQQQQQQQQRQQLQRQQQQHQRVRAPRDACQMCREECGPEDDGASSSSPSSSSSSSSSSLSSSGNQYQYEYEYDYDYEGGSSDIER